MTIYRLDVLLSQFGTSLFSTSGSNSCFLTYKQISQEAGKLAWYSHLLKNFPQFFSDPQIFCDPHNLPWSVDLTFQVPKQYSSLQHWTWLPSPVTSTTGHCFHFGSISLFFLKLFLQSPVAYWAPTDLGSSFFSVLSFCLFILFMEFSRQEYWNGLPFPSPMDHWRVLSELSTMTHPSWVALHGNGS